MVSENKRLITEPPSYKGVNLAAYQSLKYAFSQRRLWASLFGLICEGFVIVAAFPENYIYVKPGFVVIIPVLGVISFFFLVVAALVLLSVRYAEDAFYKNINPWELKTKTYRLYFLLLLPFFSIVFIYYILTEPINLRKIDENFKAVDHKEFHNYLRKTEKSEEAESYNVLFARWFFKTEEKKNKEIKKQKNRK